MSEPELPWLVVHGAWFSKAMVIVPTLVIFSGIVAFVAWRKRRQARRYAESMLRRASAPTSGRVVLEGTLRGGHVSTLHGDDRIAPDRDRALWLERDGERIQLEGPIELAHGTRCWRGRWKPPRASPPRIREVAEDWRGPTQLVEVASGDRVIVEGIARRSAGVDEASHQDPAGCWVLEPSVGALEMCAANPITKRPAWRLQPTLFGLVVLGIAVFGAVHKIGSIALASAEKTDGTLYDKLDDLAIAAAMPGSRDKALDELELRIEFDRGVSLPFSRDFARLRSGCAGDAETLVKFDRFEEAIAVGERCGATHSVNEALLLLGRFDEVTTRAEVAEAGRDSYAYIAAGKWADSAKLAQRRAASDGTDDNSCLALMFRAWAGEEHVATYLVELAARARTTTCALAAGEVVDPSIRTRTVHGLLPKQLDVTERELVAASTLADGVATVTDGADLRASLAQELLRPVMWLAPQIAQSWASDTTPDGRSARATGWRWQARMHLVAGKLDEARAAVEEFAKLHDGEPYSVASMRDRVTLHDPTATGTHARTTHLGLAWRTGRRPSGYSEHDDNTAWTRALEQAAAGDGRALARELLRFHAAWLYVGDLLAVLPRIVIGRAELAESLARYHDRDVKIPRRLPFQWVEHAALRRTLLAMAGNTVEAARWQQIVDRHVAVFSDRRRLMGLLLWTLGTSI